MVSRYMAYWRIYIYANDLYSLPGRKAHSFRDWTPQTYRRDSFELHRVLKFANRDLSVLLCNSQVDLVKVFDTLMELLLAVNMKSVEFNISLAPYLGSKTNHFVYELINYARSPYSDLISYDCTVKYRVEDPKGGSSELLSFVEFSLRVDVDEYISGPTFMDLDEDIDESPEQVTAEGPSAESVNLDLANKRMQFELRRMLVESNEHQALVSLLAQPPPPPPTQAAQPMALTAPTTVASSGEGAAATGVMDNDLGLAIERSLMERTSQPLRRNSVGGIESSSVARPVAAPRSSASVSRRDARLRFFLEAPRMNSGPYARQRNRFQQP